MSKPISHFYDFGPFRLDPVQRILLRDGEMVPLPPKVFDILQVLVENSGEVVAKEELMNRIWPDSFVEEGNLPVNIFALRKALSSDGDQNRYIKTVPKRGYLFVAKVSEVWGSKTTVGHQLLKPESRLSSEALDYCKEFELFINDQSAACLDQGGADQNESEIFAKCSGEPIRTLVSQSLDPNVNEDGARRGRQAAFMVSMLLLIVTALIALFLVLHNSISARSETRVKSIAVLPFRMVNAEPGDDYMGPAVADLMINTLTNIRQITVRPIRASLKYTSFGQDAIEVGRTLQVETVLEGSLRMTGSGMRLTAQLVRVEDGARLWELKSAEEFDNMSSLRQAVPALVTRALALELSDQEKVRLTRHQTENPAAYRLYLQGRYWCNQMTAQEVKRGIEFFERAISLDPEYAAAYADLAVFEALPVNAEPANEKLQKAKAAASRALELDESLAAAHAALARAITYCDWNWAGAEKAFKRAIELNPNDVDAHIWYSNHLSALGRHDEAIAQMRWAREIDPSSPRINLILGLTLYTARRYDQAIEQLRQTPLELGTVNHHLYLGIGLSYARQSKYEESIAAFQKAAIRSGYGLSAKVHLSYAYARAGDRDAALKILDELGNQQERKVYPFIMEAATYACLNEREKAFEWLEKAYLYREHRIIYLKVDPIFDGIRSDPRFQELMRRTGLIP